jgi:hypothetical protein
MEYRLWSRLPLLRFVEAEPVADEYVSCEGGAPLAWDYDGLPLGQATGVSVPVTIERRWVIAHSVLARRASVAAADLISGAEPAASAVAAAPFGTLSVGVSLGTRQQVREGLPPEMGEAASLAAGSGPAHAPGGRSGVVWAHAWVRVDGFPSRLLSPLAPRLATWAAIAQVWQWIGRAYAVFHGRTAFNCLWRIATALDSSGSGSGRPRWGKR